MAQEYYWDAEMMQDFLNEQLNKREESPYNSEDDKPDSDCKQEDRPVANATKKNAVISMIKKPNRTKDGYYVNRRYVKIKGAMLRERAHKIRNITSN